MTTARQTVAPLLLVLACAACGLGEDPLAGSSVGSASSPPAASNPPSPAAMCFAAPSHQRKITKPAQATLPRGGRDVFPRYRLVGYAGGNRSVDAWQARDRAAGPAGRRD